ncbi:MAG TPA: COX15/CtaA family protein [Verrucomicrobiae bacterium]|jgi:cytochrome c oxidase assembly protein subunit 15|nr:COX15/CtaA family protein [Verrucomicrobiae bacterium]
MFDANQSPAPPWRKRFAFLTALATFALIWVGGLVTSHNAGLAVPDWPNTYGYNMFFFPISKWIGNIFYEHTHRLVASAVGMLTTILMIWLIASRAPKWLRTLGIAAFVAVVAQGVLGGLRVIELKDVLGIFHATLAQLFFLLVSVIALVHTEFWQRLPLHAERDTHGLRCLLTLTTCVVLGQLMLGATMRHQHAGLSIPDFPAAYGKIWPDTDAASILKYNQTRVEVAGEQPITAAQVILQMVHRLGAAAILILVATCAARCWKFLGSRHWLTRGALLWLGLVCVQAFLGAATIWTGKSADIATAHVACGALCLMTGGLTSIVSFRILAAPVLSASRVKTTVPPFAPSSARS